MESEENRLTKRTFNRPSDSFYLKLLKPTTKNERQKQKGQDK